MRPSSFKRVGGFSLKLITITNKTLKAMEKTLKYSIHVYGELEEAIKCPLGTYYVDTKTQLYYFKSANKEMPNEVANATAEAVAHIAVITGSKVATAILIIHEKFKLLKKEDITEKDGKLIYDFRIEGEMQEYVETKFGSLYGDSNIEVYYFDFTKKGFMEPILKRKFCENIIEDLNSDDSEKKLGAEFVADIFENWTELDDEDIVRED